MDSIEAEMTWGKCYAEPQPEDDRPKQIPAVIGCDSGWIKCSDLLPEEGETVLLLRKEINGCWFYIGFCDEDSLFRHDYHGTDRLLGITHWMPLPEPPNHGR